VFHTVFHIRTADFQVVRLCDIDFKGKSGIHDVCLCNNGK
jgi:hypothetical protein